MRPIREVLLGERPRSLLVLCAPTALALVLDLALRGPALAGYQQRAKLIYLSSILLSLAFWWLPLFGAARLVAVARSASTGRARWALWAFFGLYVLPLAIFCFPGQILYRSVFGVYMGRNTLRLGIAFRTTVRDWFASWAGPLAMALLVGAGLAVTLGLAALVRRAAASRPGPTPLLAVVTFPVALGCFWFDQCDSRFLQASLPDACFVHGLVTVARVLVTGKWGVRQGVSMRTPAALPPLASERAHPPNVLVILTESVRADTSCSAPPPACTSEALDRVAADRVPLGRLTTATPNTFSTCTLLWTGLQANTDFTAAHSAPVLWELARAVGYQTAYVTSQNPNYEDFGVYVQRAGIDFLRMATDLGGMADEQVGAPDERATAETLRFVREAKTPYFALLQLANTHMPYRVAPGLEPYAPHSNTPVGDVEAFHNQYRNSVLFQERTLADFLRELRALPSWDDTVVIFLSDHGEQFREHRGLYHNHSLYEEELRVPGWLIAGARALDADQRAALATFDGTRTYTQDVHATVVDLFGLHGAKDRLPFASGVVGRSLLRPLGDEPPMLLATSTAVWEPTDARFGVIWRDRIVMGSPSTAWTCFDVEHDPQERHPLPLQWCSHLLDIARSAFAHADAPR